jgi:hypothetical protein
VTICGVLVLVLLVVAIASVLAKPEPGGSVKKTPIWIVVVIPIMFFLLAELISLFAHAARPSSHPGLPAGGGTRPTIPPHQSAIKFEAGTATSTLIIVAVVAAGVLLAGWLARRSRRVKGGFAWLEEHAPQSVFDNSVALADALALVEIPDPHQEADPRRAVVAAYLAMLHAAADAGMVRRPEETPSEFLERLLEDLGVSDAGAGHLTALFERACYSSMPVDESLRTAAIAALAQVRSDLVAFAPAGDSSASGDPSGSLMVGHSR